MEVAALSALALVVGGTIKGLTGLGLPLVSVPLLAYVIGLKGAVELIVVPIVFSNVAQSFQGGRFLHILRRFWTLLIPLVVSIVVSANLMARVPERILDLLLGISLVCLPLLFHFGERFRVRPRQERWLSPLVGLASGALGGFSTIFGPPITLYLRALGLAKSEFVASVSLLYLAGSLGIFVGIYGLGAARLGNLWLSAAACVPVAAGMWVGQHYHRRMSEVHFSRVLLVVLLVFGASFIARALGRG